MARILFQPYLALSGLPEQGKPWSNVISSFMCTKKPWDVISEVWTMTINQTQTAWLWVQPEELKIMFSFRLQSPLATDSPHDPTRPHMSMNPTPSLQHSPVPRSFLYSRDPRAPIDLHCVFQPPEAHTLFFFGSY